MNISYRWLQSLTPSLDASPRTLADRLSLLGAPVDEVVELAAEIGDVVIARVAAVRQHPNADRLRLCTVDAGGPEPLQVVCGAPNVEAGGLYPFAPIGSSLPGGVSIRRAKLRGEASEGMLCSARELGLGRDAAGLMTLHGDFTPGANFVETLGLDDVRLVLDVTPNRPELLSHLGVAREVAPEGVAGVQLPIFSGADESPFTLSRTELEGEVGGVRVVIEDPAGCPRYTAAVIRGVRVAPSPEWLAGRLRAVGLRPINNVVDATNYVLHEVGQPIHAFDLARLSGPEIRIRKAAAGESMRTLDGGERTLVAGELVIADAERAVALAGVMGGENSEVGEATTDLLIEVALFEARAVRRTARRLGLSTDASYRFERGVDPEGLPRALTRVVQLITAVAGGRAEPVAIDLNPISFAPSLMELRPSRVRQILGVELAAGEAASLLREIGFGVEEGDPLRVTVPGYRPDVTGEIDLIEEIARRRGYESFPEALLPFRPSTVPESAGIGAERWVRDFFVGRGFLEARSTGFAPASPEGVPLLNPLSAEESHLRAVLLPGLLRRVEHNWAHGLRDIRLFEIGTVFTRGGAGEVPREEVRVAAAFTGTSRPPHWSGEAPPWDLWDVKGLLEDIARRDEGSVLPGGWEPIRSLVGAAESFCIRTGGEEVGGGGRATAADAPPWAEPLWVLEFGLATVASGSPAYQPLPEHPAAERDLALLLPAGVQAGEIEAVIRERAGTLLEEVHPFDLYAGEGIPEGTRSVAWRLRFRLAERTLTDREVDQAEARILAALEEKGVSRR